MGSATCQSGVAGHFSLTLAGPPRQAAQTSPPPTCPPSPHDGGAACLRTRPASGPGGTVAPWAAAGSHRHCELGF
eukprot:8776201-Pyramimonas_sp.AAC.1